MRGYCESCQQEVDSELDTQGGDVCPHCEDDVHPGVHVEETVEPNGTDFEFDEWLLNG